MGIELRDHLDIFRLLYSLKTAVKLVFKSAYTVLHSSRAPIQGSIPQNALEHVTTLRAEHLILTPPHARELLRVLLNNHTLHSFPVGRAANRSERQHGVLEANDTDGEQERATCRSELEAKLQRYIVRRNASRITPAVKFVLGKEITAAGAMALEDLRDHPRLVEQVRDESLVKDAEAAAMVKRTVSDLRYMDVHAYLWLTGVVRKQPAMHLDANSREVHFLDLPLECWLHIRRYLKIADVASG
ncbi:hypothetical protein HPB50_016910 [Hyalomma asiaticum]|uniref:Uncharacterized protein n=1 Tax=Hyalomma asiaticum TaxID=266040 RepID=A0ACB7T2N0_HYAAI|nr:hypothetical protein HPB50_016910 [Hyalomma asiaticum]